MSKAEVDTTCLSAALIWKLDAAFVAIDRAYKKSMGDCDLTQDQLAVLLLLHEKPGCGSAVMQHELGVGAQRVVNLLANLEGRGLVVRRRHTVDRRHHQVWVSDLGREMLAKVRTRIDAFEKSWTERLSKEEQSKLDSLMSRLHVPEVRARKRSRASKIPSPAAFTGAEA